MQLSAAVQLRRQELAVWGACQGVAVCPLSSDNVLLQARPLKVLAVPSRVERLRVFCQDQAHALRRQVVQQQQ